MTISRVRFGVLTLGLAIGLFLGAEPSLARQDKPFVRITEEQARAALAVSAAAAKTNRLTLRSTYQKELRKVWADYTNTSLPIYERAELNVSLMGPAQQLLSSADERLSMEEPVTGIPWSGSVSIFVTPNNENAQNVVKIVVTRDGKEVPPLASSLSPKTMAPERGMGAGRTAKVQEGSVSFPTSAFDPGATVQVDAVLDSGRKLSRTLVDRDLRKIE